MLEKSSIFMMLLIVTAVAVASLAGISSNIVYKPANIQAQKPLAGTKGLITQKQFESKNVSTNYLTGIWKGQDQGIYYVRQLGNDIMWIGMSPDEGKTWTNVFVGKINGDIISGKWALLSTQGGTPVVSNHVIMSYKESSPDRPPTPPFGTLTLKVSTEGSKISMQKTGSTGAPFSASTWEKQPVKSGIRLADRLHIPRL